MKLLEMKLLDRFRKKVAHYDETHNFTCNICGREVFGGERVCAACMGSLPFVGAVCCPFCGRQVKEPGACLECKRKPLGVEKARSALVHEGEGARLVLRFKRGARYLFRTAADLMFPLMQEFPDVDLITFVPMTERAEKRRGYNQSRLLAEELSRRSGVPLYAGVVKRKETGAQKTLGRAEREKNLERCFHVNDRKGVKGKNILIIDDILTTGATVSELADTLKRAQAGRLFALTLTSVKNKHPFGQKSPS